jgi:hypothetical protein
MDEAIAKQLKDVSPRGATLGFNFVVVAPLWPPCQRPALTPILPGTVISHA